MSIRTRKQEAEFQKARTDATLRGEIKFVSPFPCKRGHYLRYVSWGHCVDCIALQKKHPTGWTQYYRRRIERNYRLGESW